MEVVVIRELDESLFYLFTISTMYLISLVIRNLDTEATRIQNSSKKVDGFTQTDDNDDLISVGIIPDIEDVPSDKEEEVLLFPIHVNKKKLFWLW